jgi:predicted Zn finger-like uncharacterized protein
MNVECPSCHLVGKINEVELPDEGRRLNCPRCKNSFHVAKPPPPSNRQLMSSCPSCQYSTFTEEMFAVCPKCGLTAEDAQALFRKQREKEQDARDQQALNRSFRNPDLVQKLPEEVLVEPVRAAREVTLTASLCMTLAGALLLYGGVGLFKYYSKDWQAVLSEPLLEPLTRFQVFMKLGFTPWLLALFGAYFSWSSYLFSRLRCDALKRMTEAAYGGIAVVAACQAAGFYEWVRLASGTPTLSYYGVGIMNFLLMTALLGAPFLVLLRYLDSSAIQREFRS